MKDVGKGIYSKVSLEAFGMPSSQLKVFVILLSFAGQNSECFPSEEAIRARSGNSLETRTIRRSINKLVQNGWISKRNRPGRSSIFTILNPSLLFGVDYSEPKIKEDVKKNEPTNTRKAFKPVVIRKDRPISDFKSDFDYCNYCNGLPIEEIEFADGVAV